MQHDFICQSAVVANQIHASAHSWLMCMCRISSVYLLILESQSVEQGEHLLAHMRDYRGETTDPGTGRNLPQKAEPLQTVQKKNSDNQQKVNRAARCAFWLM